MRLETPGPADREASPGRVPPRPLPFANLIAKFRTLTSMPKIHGAVTIEKERCKGCDLCVVACPCNVLSLQPKEVNDRGYHFAYPANEEACIGCAACAMVCPDACIEVYRVVVK